MPRWVNVIGRNIKWPNPDVGGGGSRCVLNTHGGYCLKVMARENPNLTSVDEFLRKVNTAYASRLRQHQPRAGSRHLGPGEPRPPPRVLRYRP
jgi:hypothetical protein